MEFNRNKTHYWKIKFSLIKLKFLSSKGYYLKPGPAVDRDHGRVLGKLGPGSEVGF